MEQLFDHDELMAISLNQIRVFLVSADRENFSKAARDLFLSQSYVSKCISSIEAKTGVILFHRYQSYVELTEAGEQLYQKWSSAYHDILDSVDLSIQIQNNSYHSLRVGDNRELKGNIYLCPIIRDFTRDYPDLEMRYDHKSLVSIVDGLKNGKFDLILCSALQRHELEEAGLEWVSVFPDSICIAVGDKHRLANAESVSFSDIREEPIIMISREIWPAYYDAVTRIITEHGGSFGEMLYVDNPHSAFMEVICGSGVLICDRMFYPSYECYMRKFDIEGEPGGVIAAWDKSNRNPYIQIFIDFILSHA